MSQLLPCRRRPALLLPNYSPSEPYEQFFAKFKHWLRGAAV